MNKILIRRVSLKSAIEVFYFVSDFFFENSLRHIYPNFNILSTLFLNFEVLLQFINKTSIYIYTARTFEVTLKSHIAQFSMLIAV